MASSSQDGQADLPPGVTDITLTDDTVLDLSAGTSTASGGNIVVEGASLPLGDFTSGDLSNTDLTVPQTIGDVSVTVGEAVNLQSGTNGDPVTLTNSDLSSVSVSIPMTQPYWLRADGTLPSNRHRPFQFRHSAFRLLGRQHCHRVGCLILFFSLNRPVTIT